MLLNLPAELLTSSCYQTCLKFFILWSEWPCDCLLSLASTMVSYFCVVTFSSSEMHSNTVIFLSPLRLKYGFMKTANEALFFSTISLNEAIRNVTSDCNTAFNGTICASKKMQLRTFLLSHLQHFYKDIHSDTLDGIASS